jgi:hypothetical protein
MTNTDSNIDGSPEVIDKAEARRLRKNERTRKWREAHKEQCQLQRKKWREANPDYHRKWSQKEECREKCRLAAKRWRENHPEYPDIPTGPIFIPGPIFSPTDHPWA